MAGVVILGNQCLIEFRGKCELSTFPRELSQAKWVSAVGPDLNHRAGEDLIPVLLANQEAAFVLVPPRRICNFVLKLNEYQLLTRSRLSPRYFQHYFRANLLTLLNLSLYSTLHKRTRWPLRKYSQWLFQPQLEQHLVSLRRFRQT